MISKSVSDSLIQQLNMEFQAFYNYLAISSYCESRSLTGFAKWFSTQSEEERGHAMKIYKYLLDRDVEPKLLDLSACKMSFESIVDAIETSLNNEKNVTASINKIATLATEEGDFATTSFLRWFIDEQVEEEATVKTMLDRVKMVEKSGEGILMLDKEFGGRKEEESAK